MSCPTNLENETISISTESTSSSSASKKQNAENQMYIKRGSIKRKSDNIIEEAVNAIKTLYKPDPIKSHESNLSNTAHTLGLFIAAKLHEIISNQRRQCENEILTH